jgi:hypothetical protein
MSMGFFTPRFEKMPTLDEDFMIIPKSRSSTMHVKKSSNIPSISSPL